MCQYFEYLVEVHGEMNKCGDEQYWMVCVIILKIILECLKFC